MSTGVSWEQFRQGVFGDPYLVWHDGPDFAELIRRWQHSRADVRELLLGGLDANEPLSAQSIAVLASDSHPPTDLLDELIARLPTSRDTFRVRLALAVFALTSDQSMARYVVSVLSEPGYWTSRMDAAMALRDFAPTVETIDALARAVTDDNNLVRYHSSDTLLAYAGFEPDASKYPEVLAGIHSDASTDQRRCTADYLRAAALSKVPDVG